MFPNFVRYIIGVNDRCQPVLTCGRLLPTVKPLIILASGSALNDKPSVHKFATVRIFLFFDVLDGEGRISDQIHVVKEPFFVPFKKKWAHHRPRSKCIFAISWFSAKDKSSAYAVLGGGLPSPANPPPLKLRAELPPESGCLHHPASDTQVPQ